MFENLKVIQCCFAALNRTWKVFHCFACFKKYRVSAAVKVVKPSFCRCCIHGSCFVVFHVVWLMPSSCRNKESNEAFILNVCAEFGNCFVLLLDV